MGSDSAAEVARVGLDQTQSKWRRCECGQTTGRVIRISRTWTCRRKPSPRMHTCRPRRCLWKEEQDPARQAVDFRFDECYAFILIHLQVRASLVVLVVKNLPANARDRRRGFDPWVKKFPWNRARQPTPGLLPGESHGWRSLVGYSPQGCKESDMTEATCTHTAANKRD